MMQLSGRILALHLAILDLQHGWKAQIIANVFVSNPVTLYYPWFSHPYISFFHLLVNGFSVTCFRTFLANCY